MKKACIFFAFVLPLIFGSAYAQTLDVEWGGYSDLEKNTQYDKVVGQDADKYYLVRVEKQMSLDVSKIWLESVSKVTNSIEMSYPLELPEVYSKKSVYENLFYIDGKLILFCAIKDNMKQRRSLYAFQIEEDGSTKTEPFFVGSIPLLTEPGFGFEYSLSPDKKKVIVQYHTQFKTYSGEPFVFKVINSDLKLVEKKEFEFPYIKRKFEVIKYDRGESGNYYFALQLEPARTRSSRGRGGRPAPIQYEYKMLVFNAMKDSFQVYNIAVEKFNPASMTYQLDKDENILIFGRATKRSAAAIAAVYYQKLNPRFERFVGKDVRDFSRDRAFLSDFTHERNGEGPDQWFSYTPGKIVFLQNGSVVYLTEQFYVDSRTMIEPKTKEETIIYYYTYGDILVVSVSEENKFEWHAKVPKMQFSTNDFGYYSSYALTTDVNKLKIMYNDNSKNFGRVSYGDIKTEKFNVNLAPSGQAALVTIYSDGNVDKAEMFMRPDKSVNICPRLFVEKDGQYFIYGQKKNDIKFGNFFFE